jgi:hypothetical protein
MSAELVSRNEQESTANNPGVVLALGATVFEALAKESDVAMEAPEDGFADERLTMSVTRIGDGQTVPDER